MLFYLILGGFFGPFWVVTNTKRIPSDKWRCTASTVISAPGELPKREKCTQYTKKEDEK